MTINRTALMVSSALAALVVSAPANAAAAQDQSLNSAAPTDPAAASAPAPAAADDPAEIVVTAQKRTQLLIDVPQSITVVSGAKLEEQHANGFADYLKLVPGLQLDQSTPGEGRLILRGVNTGGVASTVGVYMDETPFGSSSGLVNGAIMAGDFDTFDLDRIEVLRGPQGTIYGASSLSGVLKFVTKAPSTTGVVVRGRAGVETVDGGDTGYFGNLVVNAPLGQTVALRASGYYRKDGGFIDSIGTGGSDTEKNINDSKLYGGRAALLFQPSDAVSIRLTALAQNIRTDAPSIVESDPVTLNRLYGGLTQSQFIPQFTDINYRVYNGTGIFDLGFANLTSSTSYSTQKQRIRIDLTNSLSPLIAFFFGTPNELLESQHTDSTKFTQEVRLSRESDRLDWLLGGYYTHEKGLILQDFLAVVPGTLTPIVGLPTLAHAQLSSVYREIAGFADVTVHLTNRFDVDLGGRYSHNKQSAHQVSDGALAGGFNDLPVNRSSENVFTFSAAPRFELNDHASVYARVAKGFRPGGPNVLPPGAPAALASYRSDSVISYEAGVKVQSADNHLSFDAAAFHIDWKNIQLFAIVSGFGINANGGGAKSDGFEFTATARPVRGLDLSLNGAYTNARLTTDTQIGGLAGDKLPFTPKFSLGLNGDYIWPLSGSVTGHVGASLRHLSGQSGGFDAGYRATFGHQRRIRAYNVVDLGAGVDFGKISLDAYVKNLGNSAGRTSTTGTVVFGAFPIYPNGAIGTGVIRPRTIGLSLTAGL
ncbi:TonB-dependent receptor [Sphingomonas sp.]|uniref:TonB-dependent receptor n=1 Tax=Sphingomonas sp. TaxID=28214 RepID=UPI00286D5935|nr:TonB-dependent receptor [Sphingomonas sp.]